MKFLVTMNMPSNQGRSVHQMIVECKNVDCIEAFWAMLSKNDYIIAEEFYYDKEPNSPGVGTYRPRGPILINSQFIGKVRQTTPPVD